jgi:glyoxylase-like metal-dependent hydrolase (beta-lactamase superfamily II)
MQGIPVNRFIVSFVLFLFSFASYAKDFLDNFSAEKVSQHVYVIHGPLQMPNPENKGFMNNPAFIVAEKSVIVVDPGSSRDTGLMLLREIKKITDKPVSHVFNTHIHGDHWLGNDPVKKAYPDAIIFADPRMIAKAKNGEAKQWIESLLRLTDGATAGTRIVYPDKDVKDSDHLNIAGLNFKIHSVGVGHSDSDIMIELVEDSLMFTGDNVGYQRILRMDDGSFRDTISACDRAIGLQLKKYVPGHGKTGDVNIIKLQKEYLSTLYKLTARYYEEGLESYEMKPKIVEALAKFQSWHGFDSEVGKHISLAVLEVEKSEFD